MTKPARQIYEFGPYRLDAAGRVLLRDGELVSLTPKAFETLLLLVERNGDVVGKDELIESVWPDVFVEEGSLTRNISVVRKALGEGEHGHAYIETIPKRGYRFAADVQVAPSSDQLIPSGVRTDAVPPRSRAWGRVALASAAVLTAITALVAGLVMWRERSAGAAGAPPIRSVAVLPLANLSGDPAEDYFADGMTEALTTELAKVGALRVISRTSAMQYKGAQKTLPEIARELNVDAVVEGSVARSGDRVLITAQLIRAATDEHLWAEHYERDVRDVLALESEMARRIAGEIRLKLTPQEQAELTNARPVDPAAHDAYLKGLYYFNEGRNKLRPPERQAWLERSLEYFAQATAADPGFAQAHAVYARACFWLATSTRPELWPRAREEAMKAVELDDNLADAHSSLAFVLQELDRDWAGSERESLRAIQLNPSSSDAHHGYALLLSSEGRHAEAFVEIQRAVELDPLTIPLRRNVGVLLLRARQYDAAIEQLRSMIAMGPTGPGAHATLAVAYSMKGMHPEALAEARTSVELSENWPSAVGIEAEVNARAGNRKQAAEMLRGLERLPKLNSTARHNMAGAYLALGDRERALELLESVYAEDSGQLAGLKTEPDFDALASDPRFQDLLRRIGFPP